MVAYAADDRVGAKVVHSDAAGHAVFDGLDVSGSTAYYALTLLPRNGAEDRVVSDPILPAADAGMRVMLSGDKDAAPPVDDLGKVVPQPALPGGQVLAAFVGAPDADATAELYDLVAGKVIATHKLERSRAIPSTVTATMGELATTDDAPPGALRVVVRHAAGGNPVPLRDIAVLVRQGVAAPAGADAAPVAERPTVGTGVSDAAGLAKLEGLPTGVPLELTVVLEGKPITKAFTLDAAHGGTIDVTADWQVLGMYQAIFDGVAPTPEGAYLVQTTMHEQLYRSNPFQLTAGHGAAIPVYVLPRIAMTFELDGHVDDAYMAFQGSIVVQNFGWAPYAGPTEGVRVPVPRGATGLVLADQDKEWVSADADAFRLTRPVPPWGGSFRCAFSLPIDGGDVTWDLQLPYGSYESSLGILDNPGMKLDLPATQRVDMVPSMDGSRMFHALRSITIQPKQRMVFTIHGLPVAPTWPRIGRYVAGITALVLLALGLVFALDRARRAAAADDDDKDRAERKRRKRRIEELLDEVAALDRAGAGGAAASGASKGGKPGKGKGKGKGGDGPPRSRQALVAELERLYREDAAQEPARDGA
ncbi:MAG: hypothetical protein KC464_00360, partial [Myxococcales bacterium]|nr:hypothetical protein [Myxococcales bacterium]